MRIVAGRWKRRILDTPPGRGTRPILDRVKVSLFDRLGARLALPGQLPPIAVLDLFAGAGSLGIEAISRGAAYCCFVEQDRRAFATLQSNLDALAIVDEAEARCADALTFSPPSPPTDAGYELVFVDPPYAMARDADPTGPIGSLCRRLAAAPVVEPDALLVLRHESWISYDDLSDAALQLDERLEYGGMALTLLRVERD